MNNLHTPTIYMRCFLVEAANENAYKIAMQVKGVLGHILNMAHKLTTL